MSEQETLRMAAEIVDKFSKPIRDMQRSLRALSDQTKGTHRQGVSDTKDHSKAFRDLHKDVSGVANTMKTSLAPAMAAFGVGSISVAAGVAGVTAAVKEFVGSSRALSFVSKEVGLTIQQLRVYEALAARVGSSAGAMDSGLETFAHNMEEFRRQRGALAQWFSGQASPGTRQFGAELRKTTDNATALKMVLGALAGVQGPDPEVNRRNILQEFGLPLELSRLSGKQLKETLTDLQKMIKPLTAEQIKAGVEGQKSFDRLRESAASLRDQLGGSLAPAVTRVADALRNFLVKNDAGITKTVNGIAAAIEGADWRGMASDIKEAATSVNSVAQGFGGWKNVLEGLVAIKAASWLLGIATALKAVSAAMPAWLVALLPTAAAVAGTITQKGSAMDTPAKGSLGDTSAKVRELETERAKIAGDANAGSFLASKADLLRALDAKIEYYKHVGSDPDKAGAPAPKKMSYQQTGDLRSLLQKASYSPGAAPGENGGSSRQREFTSAIATGTRKGVFDGLWDWANFMRGGGAATATGSSAAAIKASLSPGGGVQSPGATGMQEPMVGPGSGNTRGDRNNNPGNMEYGAFAKAHGATGSDGRFAIFPSREAGTAAMGALLKQNYDGMTLGALAREWVGPGIPDSYIKGLEKSTGLNRNQVPDLDDKAVLDKIQQGIMTGEGTAGHSAPSQNGRGGRNLASLGGMMKESARSSFNLMHGQYGRPGENLTTIATPSGKKVTINRAAAGAFKGFLSDLEKMGAPIHSLGGYANRNIAGSGSKSQHAYGNAIDVNQSARNVVSRDFAKWALEHKDALIEAQKKHGISSGGNMSSPDFGHFEWTGKQDEPDDRVAGLHGDALRKHFGHPGRSLTDPPAGSRPNLLEHAQRAGLMGQTHKMTGEASLKIDLNGFPKGTRTASASSGFFKEIALNRGRVPLADQDA